MLPQLNRLQKIPIRRLTDKGIGRVSALIVLLLWLAALGLLALNRQNIIDWWRLRNYDAPTAVSALASQDTMTAYARKVFFVNYPAVDNKSAFNHVCPNNGGEQTIVLGCYHSNQDGIFLLGVTDPRLNGVEQVTAAHEMLHAAYDRLNTAERNKVNAMLQTYYDHDLHDQRIRTTIAAYRKTEPHDVVNEMHSVFGTEILKLPAGLEQYYQRYFTNRAQVASYASQYQAELSSRQTTVDNDDAQLRNLKAQISSAEADLKARQAGIDAEQSRLAALRSSNVGAYNAGVPGYNVLVDAYNQQVKTVRRLVDQYNQLVTSRNAVASEIDQLIQDLSSSAAPIQE